MTKDIECTINHSCKPTSVLGSYAGSAPHTTNYGTELTAEAFSSSEYFGDVRTCIFRSTGSMKEGGYIVQITTDAAQFGGYDPVIQQRQFGNEIMLTQLHFSGEREGLTHLKALRDALINMNLEEYDDIAPPSDFDIENERLEFFENINEALM